MKDLSKLSNRQLAEIAAKLEKKVEVIEEKIEEKEEKEEPEDNRILESLDKLINAVRALRQEPQKVLVQPKISMPDLMPTINVQASDVTVPHTVHVAPAEVKVEIPEHPKKWKFKVTRNVQNLITEITAEVIK